MIEDELHQTRASIKSSQRPKLRPQRAVPPMKKTDPMAQEQLPSGARLSNAASTPVAPLPTASDDHHIEVKNQTTDQEPNLSESPLQLPQESEAKSANVKIMVEIYNHYSYLLPPPPNPFCKVDSFLQDSQMSEKSSSSKKSFELLADSDGQSRDLDTLARYQQQQKMMEELNRKKKEMLSKALAER